jgi:hypothetical protein
MRPISRLTALLTATALAFALPGAAMADRGGAPHSSSHACPTKKHKSKHKGTSHGKKRGASKGKKCGLR